MGAIAGILYPEHFPLSYGIGPMLDALRLRAPESPTTYLYKNLELGCRGTPIGHDRRRTLSLAMDGEITNRKALAKELKKGGFPAEGAELADLLVMAYEHWGPDFAIHLEGPFAIAVFDQQKGELHLLRDRLGIRPLYWCYQGESLLFASELKALLASGLIPQVVDEDAISAFLFLGYVPQDLSPIKGVNKLLPGCRLTLAGAGNLSITPYWSYGALLSEDRSLPAEELASRLQAELRASLPEGELGYLTDGTMPAAALASTIPQGEALCAEYQGQNEEQVQQIIFVAESLGHGVKTTSLAPAALLEALPQVVWHLDEPLADPGVMGLWNLLQGPASSKSHIVTDVGCGELLATRKRYTDPHLLALLDKPPTAGAKGLKQLWLQLLRVVTPTTLFHLLRKAHTRPWLSYYINSQSLFRPHALKQLSPQIPRFFDPDAAVERLYQLSGLESTSNAYLFLDERTYLPGKLLLPYDRLGSASKTQWIAPFLREPIVEMVANVPDRQKLAADPTQHPLYQLIAPKTKALSFSDPAGPAFLNPYLNDPTIRQALGYLVGGTLVETGWLDRRWVKRALERHLPEPATFTQLWGLLNLEVWMRLYINTPAVGEPPTAPLFQILQKG